MAVRIRLTRVGARNRPYWRIAVFDSRTRRDGRYLEKLGNYDPKMADDTKKINVKSDRLKYWLGNGALLTKALKGLLKKAGKLPK